MVGEQASVRLLEPLTGKELGRLRGDERDLPTGLTFTPGGKILAVTGLQGHARLWDLATGQELVEIKDAPRAIRQTVAFSADGKVMALAGETPQTPRGARIRLRDNENSRRKQQIGTWETATGKELRRFEVEVKRNAGIALSADGKTLVAWDHSPTPDQEQDQKGTIRHWDLATGRELASIKAEGGPVRRAAFSPDGKVLAAAIPNGSVLLLDAATGKELRRLAGPEGSNSFLTFSPDGKVLAAGNRNGVVEGWDLATGQPLGLVGGPTCRTGGLAFTGDRRLLAWGIQEPVVCPWDARTGKQLTPQVGHQTEVTSLTFTPDGQRLISGGPDGRVCIWDVATGTELHRITTPADRVTWRLRNSGSIVSPDGKYVAVRLQTGPLLLWETVTGKYVLRLGRNPLRLSTSLMVPRLGTAPPVFSPDGRLVAMGAQVLTDAAGPGEGPNKVLIWELASGAVRTELNGATGTITALAFSPDGRRLAAGGSDTTILVWDLTRRSPPRPAAAANLTAKQLDDLWGELASLDGPKAYQAMQTLAAAPRSAVAYLARALGADKTVDAAALDRLIADLDDADFAVREKASRALEQMGRSAAGALRDALARKPSPEAARRLRQLLEKLGGGVEEAAPKRPDAGNPPARQVIGRLQDPGDPEVLPPTGGMARLRRAVEVLENIATPEAREVLTKLAKGRTDDPLTQEARDAVRRLARRGTTP